MTRAGLLTCAVAWLLAVGCADRRPAAVLKSETPRLRLGHGGCDTLRLRWTPLRPLDRLHGSPVIFVHLYNDDLGTVRTFDHPLPFPWTARATWVEQVDICSSALAPPLKPGRYSLRVGLYDNGWGYRWPLRADKEESAPHAYPVAVVDVDRVTVLPRVSFQGAWSVLEVRRADQQVPARRTLRGAGSIVVRGAAGRTLRLIIAVPTEGILLSLNSNPPETLEVGRVTWETPLSSDAEVLSIAPATASRADSTLASVEEMAFKP